MAKDHALNLARERKVHVQLESRLSGHHEAPYTKTRSTQGPYAMTTATLKTTPIEKINLELFFWNPAIIDLNIANSTRIMSGSYL